MPSFYYLLSGTNRSMLRDSDYKLNTITDSCPIAYSNCTSVQLVLSGVAIDTGCHAYSIGGGKFGSYNVGGSINGTYALTTKTVGAGQSDFTKDYLAPAALPVELTGYLPPLGGDNPTCDGTAPNTVSSPDEVLLTVRATGTTISISAQAFSATPNRIGASIFSGAITIPAVCKCLTLASATNVLTAFASVSPSFVIGKNGVATITFTP